MDADKEGYLNSYEQRMKMFLDHADAGMNVILENDFKKFLPLFNRDAISRMTDTEVAELMYEYSTSFDATRPIHVISNELDDNGILYVGFEKRIGDGKKHKLLMTFPPSRRRLKTMNEAKVSLEAIDQIAGGLQQNNPQSQSIRAGLEGLKNFANTLSDVSEDELKKVADMEKALLNPEEKPSEPTGPDPDSDPEDIDADWEE